MNDTEAQQDLHLFRVLDATVDYVTVQTRHPRPSLTHAIKYYIRLCILEFSVL